jgi:hypothetical protein
MNFYYPAYLLLQKIYSEQLHALKNLTVYKSNDWEDEFGKKIQSSMVFEAIRFLELKKFLKVTNFRECSTCTITEEGKLAYKKFENSDDYTDYLKSTNKTTVTENNIQVFFDHKNKEQFEAKQMVKLNRACSAFFSAL